MLLVAVTAKRARPYYNATVVDAGSWSEHTEEETQPPVRQQDCFLPKSVGPCRGYFSSYYYNKVSKQCEFFVWSGCGGNKNRFDSLESCQKLCTVSKVKRVGKKTVKRCNRLGASPDSNKGCGLPKHSYNRSTRKSVCHLPAVRGNCRALLPRWRYDPKKGKCAEFKFGGCNGNGNNFTTRRQCMKTCGSLTIVKTVPPPIA